MSTTRNFTAAPRAVAVKESGIMQAVAERLRKGGSNSSLPYVTLTFAQSIDGSIAAKPGKPLRLSNTHSQTMTHQLRAMHDGILVGINTVLADDPRLTVRLVDGDAPRPIVLDSQLRFPLNARLLENPAQSPIIVCTDLAEAAKVSALEAVGASVISLPQQPNGKVALEPMLAAIKRLGIAHVMVEGGAKVITSFVHSQLVNQLVLTICPVFVGGMPCFNGHNALGESLPKLVNMHTEVLSGDLVVRGDLQWLSKQ